MIESILDLIEEELEGIELTDIERVEFIFGGLSRVAQSRRDRRDLDEKSAAKWS
tara:strand:+ start:12194 stop:12355 length:162 start_codon:yes stop_codon:yes gene_type:complete